MVKNVRVSCEASNFLNYLYIQEGDLLHLFILYRTMVWKLRVLPVFSMFVLRMVLKINSCYFCARYYPGDSLNVDSVYFLSGSVASGFRRYYLRSFRVLCIIE
jgi:hypothetical protein